MIPGSVPRFWYLPLLLVAVLVSGCGSKPVAADQPVAADLIASTGLQVTVKSQTGSTVTLTWTPPGSCIVGYAFLANGAKVSTSASCSTSTVRFSHSACYTGSGCSVVADEAGLSGGVYLGPPPVTSTTTTTPTTTTTTTTTTTIQTTTTSNPGAWQGDFVSSYDAAQPGQMITVPCGVYGNQRFDKVRSSGAPIVFQPATPFCAEVDGLVFTNGGSYATFQYLKINDSGRLPGIDSEGAPTPVDGVQFRHDHINVDVNATTYPVYVRDGNNANWLFDSNTIGPMCCGDPSQPVGPEFRVAANTGGEQQGWQITNNLFQSTMRYCRDWPSTYTTVENPAPVSAGACPASDCSGCHMDAIHIYGGQNFTISGNRFYNIACQGIFVEDSNGGVNGPMTIVANAFLMNSDNCNSAITLTARSGSQSITGAWNISFNTAANNPISIAIQSGTVKGSMSITMVGNLAPLYLPNGSCTSQQGGETVTYSYNAWMNYGGAQNAKCGSSDVYPVAPMFVSTAETGTNLNLTGPLTAADNLVPAAVCVANDPVDANGVTRPLGVACDAGAFER